MNHLRVISKLIYGLFSLLNLIKISKVGTMDSLIFQKTNLLIHDDTIMYIYYIVSVCLSNCHVCQYHGYAYTQYASLMCNV